jgi:transglutaminase-like putative cysteine protease
MKRRDFLQSAAAASALATLAPAARAQATFDPRPGAWRVYEVVTRVELPAGAGRAWVPLPAIEDPAWIRPGASEWTGNARSVRVVSDGVYSAQMVLAEWDAGAAPGVLEVTSRFATRDRAVDLSQPRDVAPLDAADRRFYLAATELMPTDGIVRKTALDITRKSRTDVDKARAIYEWVVDNTFREPSTRGCGVGDIKAMLETGNLSGKCADLNALYVGLARAAGLPARDVYGIRVAPSRFGYRSLGVGTSNVTRAQHCRAEVWLAGFGWVPVDPADVRKVILEEPPGKLAMSDPKVTAARQKLFGAWEMNWLAYNFAHDVKLPGSTGAPVAFLMYPQAETARGRVDPLDPDRFKYTITARDVAA